MILNIRSKLILSYLAMAVLTVLASAYAVGHLRDLNKLAFTVINQDFQLLETEKQMMETLLAWEGAEKKYLILKDPSMADIFWARSQEFQSQLAILKKESPQGRDNTVEQLSLFFSQYNAIFHKETSLVGENRIEEAVILSSQEGRRIIEKMAFSLRSLQMQSEKDIDARMNAINIKGQEASRMTILLTGASLIVGLFLAAAITFNISRPLRKLEKATGFIAEGHFDTQINIQRRDEIGSLARAFNAMTKRLKILETLHLDASPLTGLPGNLAIEQEIERRLREQELFSLCHLDLDNFKPFADHYGYAWGSEVIKEVAVILEDCRQKWGRVMDFIGHIGGDDFILIAEPSRAEAMCRCIVEEFDQRIRKFYSEEDQQRGFILAKDRQGQLREFPLVTVTLSIVTGNSSLYRSPLEMAKMAAEVKNYGKTLSGINYVKKEDMDARTSG
ncbi:MAG TPA: HAMP domain-containing protein [Syntrophales bacterium]